MYAEITFKNPILQRLNEILDHLEINFEMYCTHYGEQQLMTSEEAVKRIAAELVDAADLDVIAEVLGLECSEDKQDASKI